MRDDWRDDEMKVECANCIGHGSVGTGTFRGGPTSDIEIMRPCGNCEARGWSWIDEGGLEDEHTD